MSWEKKQVIVVRTDVKMSPAKMAVQVAHASVSPIIKNMIYGENIDDEIEGLMGWYADGLEQKKVVLKVDSEDEIYRLQRKALLAKIGCFVVKDAGLTEVPPNTVTAIGFEPCPNEIIDEITGDLKLFR